MSLENLALRANGFRTPTSRPGHHQTLIQPLGQTIGLDVQAVMALDALRKQRNIADYSGGTIPASAVRDCVSQAGKLMMALPTWLK